MPVLPVNPWQITFVVLSTNTAGSCAAAALDSSLTLESMYTAVARLAWVVCVPCSRAPNRRPALSNLRARSSAVPEEGHGKRVAGGVGVARQPLPEVDRHRPVLPRPRRKAWACSARRSAT